MTIPFESAAMSVSPAPQTSRTRMGVAGRCQVGLDRRAQAKPADHADGTTNRSRSRLTFCYRTVNRRVPRLTRAALTPLAPDRAVMLDAAVPGDVEVTFPVGFVLSKSQRQATSS